MSLLRIAVCATLGLLLCIEVQAEEPAKPGPQPLLQTLPKDGEWVSYYVLMKINSGENQVEWKAASVGTKQVNGEPHRWLELSAKAGEDVYRVYKALIPESKFAPGKNPLGDAKDLWVRRGDDEPERISSLLEDDPYLALLLSGPVSNVKKLDETKTIDWQKGRVECEVWEGENKLETQFLKVNNTQRLYKSKTVPFGVAGATVHLSGGGETADVEYILDKFGTGAKTLLPEIK